MSAAADAAVRYFAVLSDSDVEGAVALVADNADFRSPMGQMNGKDEIRVFLGGFDTAFPGARFDIDNVLELGNLVAVEGVYSGVHGGPLMLPDGGSLPATGRSVSAPFVTMLEVSEGAITSHRPYWDVAALMAQLTA